MPKMQRFTIAPDGRLVYATNGTVVRGTPPNYGSSRADIRSKGYSIIGDRVYRNGRMVGRIKSFSNLSKKQQAAIAKRAASRRRRAEKQAIKEALEEAQRPGDSGWKHYRDAKRAMDDFRKGPGDTRIEGSRVETSKEAQSKLNFAAALDQAVRREICDEEGASEAWLKYIEGDDALRSELWTELTL